jgi:glycosyltransferase involved in cell wall biosynthesis
MNIFKKIEIKIKNKFINKKINVFINEKIGHPLLERETELKPEILIPCYNHGKYLKTALESIPTGIPVTIINDCSTDNSLDIIKELQGIFHFKLINNEINLNQTGSLNKAIENSVNNLFIILNADDTLNNMAINTIISTYERLSNIRMLGAGGITFTKNESLRFNKTLPDTLPYVPRYDIFNLDKARKYRRLNDINMTMSGSSFLKSAWIAVGGFLPYKQRVCSYDDRDFQMRVSALFDVAVIEEPLAFYRLDSSTGVSQQ